MLLSTDLAPTFVRASSSCSSRPKLSIVKLLPIVLSKVCVNSFDFARQPLSAPFMSSRRLFSRAVKRYLTTFKALIVQSRTQVCKTWALSQNSARLGSCLCSFASYSDLCQVSDARKGSQPLQVGWYISGSSRDEQWQLWASIDRACSLSSGSDLAIVN